MSSNLRPARAFFALLAIIGTPTAFTAETDDIETTVHSFTGGEADGHSPNTALVQGRDGFFYGTQWRVGSGSLGAIFKMDTTGAVTILHRFTQDEGPSLTGLIQASDGNFYGTTGYVAFRMDPAGAFTVIHRFLHTNPEGTFPSGLSQGSDGAFYGTTEEFGASLRGSVFRMVPDGTVTTLHSFTVAEGRARRGVIQASDGNLYGTIANTGSFGVNGVFKLDGTGTLTMLHVFDHAEGGGLSGLIQASDGRLYGTAVSGGARGQGTVFSIDIDGSLTALHSFTGEDGSRPSAGVIEGSDGRFYGTTQGGFEGAILNGTVFAMDASGTVTNLHFFTGRNGSGPRAGLTEASDGRLYGTTEGGGALGPGVVFRLTPGTGQVAVRVDGGESDTVTSTPEGIDCGVDCSGVRHVGDTLTLTAAPAAGSTFHGWGGACAGVGTCSLTIGEAAQFVSAKFLPSGADSVESALSEPPAALEPGGTFGVTHTTLNQDALEAGSSTTRFYVATDLDTAATYRRLSVQIEVPPLPGGGSSNGAGVAKLPPTLPLGTYWFVGCADNRRIVDESNEENNCRASSTTMRVALPDLRVAGVTSAAQGSLGNPLVVTDTVRNRGEGPARESRVGYYLSTNRSKNSEDVRLSGQRQLDALAPSATTTGMLQTKVPSSVAPGSYFVLACADDRLQVNETDEGNNCRSSEARVAIHP